jgi:hypothetical protein
MKNILATLTLALVLIGLTANAQYTTTVTNYVTITNTITAPVVTLGDSGHMPMDESKSNSWPMEVTFGAAGVTVPHTGQTSFGLDVGLSVQPFTVPIWFGISQEFTWSPSFAGSTDLDATYAFAIIKDKLYLNAGWSGGAVYDRSSIAWRSGPELQLEYYTKGNAFLYVGANYDLINHDAANGWTVGANANPLRYSAGIGIAF